MTNSIFALSYRIPVLSLVLVLFAGCGSNDGPRRYQLTGTVTYDGKPVPKGFVTLTPNTDKGNTGPGGGAPIVDGRYTTPKDMGLVGGPHRVKIVGYDGIPTAVGGEKIPDGKSLFPPYEAEVDLPKQDGEQNFEVPK